MKNLLASTVILLTLSACAGVGSGLIGKQNLIKTWAQSCLAYEGAQKGAIAYMPKMSRPDLLKLKTITDKITPLCQSVPANPGIANLAITKALTEITGLLGHTGTKS